MHALTAMDFHVRHGEDSVLIDGWHVYADGARRTAEGEPILEEPSANAYERYGLIAAYWKAKVKLLRQEAERLEERGCVNDRARELRREAKTARSKQIKALFLQCEYHEDGRPC